MTVWTAADRAGLSGLGKASGSVNVPATSAMVLIDAAGFSQLQQEAPESLVYIRYKDRHSGTVVCEQRLIGELNSEYTADPPSELLFKYHILSRSALSGVFSKAFAVVEVDCEAYEGAYSTVTVRFTDADDKQLANTVVMTNRVGQQYFTPSVPGIAGYALDLDSLPKNGAGLYAEEDTQVVYRYLPVEKKDEKEDKQDK